MRIFLISLLAISLLSGCVTSSIKSTSLDKNKKLPPSYGVIALQVINNAERLSEWHKGWTEVIAARVDNLKEVEEAALKEAREETGVNNDSFEENNFKWSPDFYSFDPINEGTVDSQLFIGNMPEGEYVISSLYSYFSNGSIRAWVQMPVLHAAGKFEVKRNGLTDLGTIVFQPLQNVKKKTFWSSGSSMKAFVTRVFQKQALRQYVVSHFPLIQKQLGNSEPLGWQKDALDEFRNNLGQLARKNAFAATPIVVEKGEIKVLAGKFGILNIQKNNQWQAVNLPTNSQLYAAMELDGKILAGGELGQLHVSSDWKNWQSHKPINADEAIVWFGRTERYNYALSSSAKQYQLYQFSAFDQLWRQVGSFTKKDRSTWVIQNGGLFPFVTQTGNICVINDNQRLIFNEQDGKWASTKTDPLRSMAQLPNGTLVAVSVSQWDGIGSQTISRDDGVTWVDLNRSIYGFEHRKAEVTLPAITSSGQVVTLGQVIKSPENKQESDDGEYDNEYDDELKLVLMSSPIKSISDSDSWVMRSPAKEDCQTLLPVLTTGERVYFLCDQGEIMSTDDFGNSWKVEIDRDIEAMQKQYEAFIQELKAKKKDEKNGKDQAHPQPKP